MALNFRLEPFYPEQDITRAHGTSLKCYVTARGTDLVRLLGPAPHVADQYKVAFEWIFVEGASGRRVTLYDYKATSTYHPNNPSPEEFLKTTYDWHIGAGSEDIANRFRDWLNSKLVELQAQLPRSPISLDKMTTQEAQAYVKDKVIFAYEDKRYVVDNGSWFYWNAEVRNWYLCDTVPEDVLREYDASFG